MKKIKNRKLLSLISLLLAIGFLLTACRESDRVSYNLSKEADNFNIVRKITVVNAIQGKTLFEITGKMSIHYNDETKQLEIIAEDEDGQYKKHFVGISDNVSYIVEDITGKNISNTKFTIVFNPDMILPTDAKLAD